MVDPTRRRWDKWFLDEKSYQLDINYTPWLDQFIDLLESLKPSRALDLGCGRGFDSQYLRGLGLNTFTSDYSWGALCSTEKTLPSAERIQFDMRDGFPFQRGFFGVIVANLSLHYFSLDKTIEIVHEIHQALMPRGWLIGRVNSTSDHGYQSVKDDPNAQIEEDYYFYHDIPRRYFREPAIRQFFSSGWKIVSLEERVLARYEKPKTLWEFVVQRVK